VQQVFQIQVMQPTLKRGETSTFPVVYVTDANWTFDALKGISYSMQLSGRDAPRFILVGIGYPSDCPDAGALLRGRDMTFPGYPEFSRTLPPTDGVLVADKGTKDFYGAEDFQRFIEDELILFIDGKYQTIPGDRTYFGHSLGGGFGLFTLFSRSILFGNYIISSPGLYYNGETSAGFRYTNYDFVFEDARRFIESRKPIRNTRLYMSVGSEEEYEIDYAPWQLTSSAYRLASLMKAAVIPGLEFMFEVFRGEIHMTAWPMAFMHGVKSVFGTRVWAVP
jgi:predicted alpha/beta superfamily hydrolase